MGIHRLLITLQDHGSSVELGSATSGERVEPLQGSKRQVVIDGPGLAYYAHDRAFAARPHAGNAFEAMPSYAEVGDVVVDFLSVLEKHGLAIAAIFFDGLLPEAKREVRVSRLLSYTKQLVNFRASNPEPLRVSRVTVRKIDFGQYRSIPEKLRGLPASPFLVPAVIDHLNGSRFSRYVSVVPAEADVFCADLVRSLSNTSSGCWLITNDSDLLIHDLGAAGSILRFPDISVSTLPGRSSLKGFAYCPSEIAKTFGLRSLQPFGFALQQDSHRSLQQCLRFAKGLDDSDGAYREFLKEFEPLSASYKAGQGALDHFGTDSISEDGKSDQCDALSALTKHLRRLDPRISELIHQIGYPLTTAPPSPNAGPKDYFTYLPFLIEDSSRASAWRISASLRQLSYMTLGRFLPPSSSLYEFARRGTRVVGDPVDLPGGDHELTQALRTLQSDMVALKSSIGDETLCAASPALFWKLFAVAYLCSELSAADEQQQKLPTAAEVLRLLAEPPRDCFAEDVVSWDAIHRAAQVQGVLYSLRMLRQVLDVVISATKAQPQAQSPLDATTTDMIFEMAVLLDSMPPASLLFDGLYTSDETLTKAISCLPNLAADVDAERKKKKKSRKRQHENEGGARDTAAQKRVLPTQQQQQVAGSRFGFLDMLGDEDGSD